MRSYLQKHDNNYYSDHYSTPKDIYNHYVVNSGYHDPCPLNGEGCDLNKIIDSPMFINPPYSDIKTWVDYALFQASKTNKHIVMLIPSRTDTKYFHKLLEYGVDLEFIKGRLKFGNMKKDAPFPSVLVHLNKHHEE